MHIICWWHQSAVNIAHTNKKKKKEDEEFGLKKIVSLNGSNSTSLRGLEVTPNMIWGRNPESELNLVC